MRASEFISEVSFKHDPFGRVQRNVPTGKPGQRYGTGRTTNSAAVQKLSPLMYKGYPCTKDCSGHEAGYNWAQMYNITNPDDCGGNPSFWEGCKSKTEGK